MTADQVVTSEQIIAILELAAGVILAIAGAIVAWSAQRDRKGPKR